MADTLESYVMPIVHMHDHTVEIYASAWHRGAWDAGNDTCGGMTARVAAESATKASEHVVLVAKLSLGIDAHVARLHTIMCNIVAWVCGQRVQLTAACRITGARVKAHMQPSATADEQGDSMAGASDGSLNASTQAHTQTVTTPGAGKSADKVGTGRAHGLSGFFSLVRRQWLGRQRLILH